MSTNEQTMTKTWEEYDATLQRARRAAFLAGAEWWSGAPLGVSGIGGTEKEARRRYPLRKKVPRVVKVKSFYARLEANLGSFENITGIAFYFDRDCTQKHTPHWHDADSVAAMADLLANPFEEVEE